MNAQICAAQARAITRRVKGCAMNAQICATDPRKITTHARASTTHAEVCTVIAVAGAPDGGARATVAVGCGEGM